jgi:hypothetical protein
MKLARSLLIASAIAGLPLSAGSASAGTPETKTVIDGLDYGPLARFVGTWKTLDDRGLDVAPGQEGSEVGKGGEAASPYYETIQFIPAGGVTNASSQHLVAISYHQKVFRKSNNQQFHDQVGYLIYDKANETIYDSFCIPRAVCVVAAGKLNTTLSLTAQGTGIVQSDYMAMNDKTEKFTISYEISEDIMQYSQETTLHVYGKPFIHTDIDTLTRVKG